MLIDICKTYFDDRFDVSLLYTRKLNKKLKSYLNWDWILTSADWLNLQNLGIWKGKKKKKVILTPCVELSCYLDYHILLSNVNDIGSGRLSFGMVLGQNWNITNIREP